MFMKKSIKNLEKKLTSIFQSLSKYNVNFWHQLFVRHERPLRIHCFIHSNCTIGKFHNKIVIFVFISLLKKKKHFENDFNVKEKKLWGLAVAIFDDLSATKVISFFSSPYFFIKRMHSVKLFELDLEHQLGWIFLLFSAGIVNNLKNSHDVKG